MDRPGKACPVTDPAYHMPNIPRDEAHVYANQGSSMVAHHKSPTDVIGAGMGWILANSISKAQFAMQHQHNVSRLHKQ